MQLVEIFSLIWWESSDLILEIKIYLWAQNMIDILKIKLICFNWILDYFFESMIWTSITSFTISTCSTCTIEWLCRFMHKKSMIHMIRSLETWFALAELDASCTIKTNKKYPPLGRSRAGLIVGELLRLLLEMHDLRFR